MDTSDRRNTVHPTAILDGNIQMGEGNTIGPHVVLSGDITLGNHNTIEAGVIIQNNVTIGNDNYFYPYASIGALGEMGLKGDSFNEEGRVVIGNHVTVREFVCIHSPVYRMETQIDDRVYLMNKCYVAHDCHIGKGTVISAGVLLAGRVVIGQYANLGLGSTVHQRLHIGSYTMVGMQSVVTRDVLPYCTVAGNPARILGFNHKGAERCQAEPKWLAEMQTFFQEGIQHDWDSVNPIKKEVYAFLMKHPEALVKVK